MVTLTRSLLARLGLHYPYEFGGAPQWLSTLLSC